MDDEKNAKILEVDPGGKPGRHASRRRSGGSHLQQSSCSTRTSEQNSRSYATMPESPSRDSTTAQQSVPSPASVGMGEALSPLRMPVDIAELYDSPQFYSATASRPGSSKRGGVGVFTPTKSECARSLFGGYSDYPNYMANTESFRAKARSQSAPKQRPAQYDKSGSLRKASAHAFAPGPASSLHAKFTNKAYPGSGRLDRLGMPVKY